MDKKFLQRTNKLPLLLTHLKRNKAITRKDLSSVPQKGVYMFIERDKPIYIGRTNRMRARLSEHGSKSAGHNDASFAFRIAKELAEKDGINIKRKRNELVHDTEFYKIFKIAKDRVSKMNIKCIEIEDQVDQTLFEVYASIVLKTPYNDFKNH